MFSVFLPGHRFASSPLLGAYVHGFVALSSSLLMSLLAMISQYFTLFIGYFAALSKEDIPTTPPRSVFGRF